MFQTLRRRIPIKEKVIRSSHSWGAWPGRVYIGPQVDPTEAEGQLRVAAATSDKGSHCGTGIWKNGALPSERPSGTSSAACAYVTSVLRAIGLLRLTRKAVRSSLLTGVPAAIPQINLMINCPGFT